ncbi:MAG: right-handed parallel beta-helix repeat-containing protein [Phycisphaerales bacterium]|nr:MAG: right-handed parallel beta-helix repeat-containing protein [Phycisphaerales bacterium]
MLTSKKLSMFTVILTCSLSVFGPSAMAVTVPAGSVDQLAAAIAEAGPGGQVVLEAGVHKESGTVLVDTTVSIVGQDGAVLEAATTPGSAIPVAVEPALHIKAAGARVSNLSIRAPKGATANCAILIEDAPDVEISDNTITDHQLGILIQNGHRAQIQGNRIRIVSTPDSGLPENGIVVINGDYVTIRDNWVSHAFVGIFLSGSQGDASGNTTTESFLGVIFCNPTELYAISGQPAVAHTAATGWIVYQNASFANSWGYIVIDGANNNTLVNNSAALNAMYDIELAGDSMRFGFLTPASYDNMVVQGLDYQGLKVKDCGTNNEVRGHVNLVDTSEDTCF